jgi:hypothetical protein
MYKLILPLFYAVFLLIILSTLYGLFVVPFFSILNLINGIHVYFNMIALPLSLVGFIFLTCLILYFGLTASEYLEGKIRDV